MEKYNLLVFEDSSKSKFGGGQKETLKIIKVLENYFEIYAFDTDLKSVFAEKLKTLHIGGFNKLYFTGKIGNKPYSSFNTSLLELITTPFLIVYNLLNVLHFLKIKNINNFLIYAATKKVMILAILIKRIFPRCKVIYHAHNIITQETLYSKIFNFFLKKCDLIICVANAVKNSLKIKKDNMIVVPNSIEISPLKQPKSINNIKEIIVASFTSLIKWKGIEYFMESYRYLKNKDIVKYYIYGFGKEMEYLKSFENENVILKGFCDNVGKILDSLVHIVVLPSIDSEACPEIVLEALACGIPVITTDMGGQKELIYNKNVGFCVPSKNAKAIAAKIDYLIDNPEIYNEYSKNALEYAKQFDIDIYKKNIIEIFNKILNEA